MNQNIFQLMNNFSHLLIDEINQILPTSEVKNSLDILYSAMRYTTLAPAKHLRPFLVFVSSQIFNIEIDRILPVCVAVEFIHVYSLIHDDLPAMDNDDMRRGQLSCHKKFNEAIAILTGDALLTLAFELLSTTREDSDIRCQMISILAQFSGYKGMIGGQILDITQSNKDFNDIQTMQTMKTSKLFSAACALGGILGGATDLEVQSLINYGKKLGCAFQVKDDIDDINQDKSSNNIVTVIGIDKAIEYMNLLFQQSINCLEDFSCTADTLRHLVNFVRGLR